ncbi:MAG: ribosomal protein S12 methylthiotransferase RimO [Nitrospirae bacterium RBG_19FT_COMBO_42_15]|nr:MAG: ribosomal protein S12 methylthiotransferase RimO [Nitrospirae bacterium RBG_19FT_COMBO_42_15]
MKKVGLISLGCPKNQVDAEIMLGYLTKAGFTITNKESEAEIAIVNTCGFINDAKEESVERIIEAVRLKENGSCKALIVAGCLSERYKEELIKELPEVDAFIGISEIEKIAEVCRRLIDNVGADPSVCPPNYGVAKDSIGSPLQVQEPSSRILINPQHYAYVKIAEGCNNRCSYCTIPSIRGSYKSREIESIINEVKQFVSNGVKEINIVAQDTTDYGLDIYKKRGLAELLKELVKINNQFWIRLLYTYPEHFNDELIDIIAGEDKICNYIDIPIQHIDDDILKSMKRSSTEKQIKSLIEKLRRRIPDIVLRTSLIAGFPGETEAQFKKLYDFVKEAEFHRLGVFAYSKEEGTPASKYKNQITQKIKDRRRNEIMRLQSGISLSKNRELIGKTLKALINGLSNETELLIDGRYYGQAPEVDGVVYINDVGADPRVCPTNMDEHYPALKSGDFVNVEITEAHEYDIVGKVI